jgi:hypothetical protein
MIATDQRTQWRDTFERSYGAGRFEEFCKYVVVDQTRPGVVRDRFHSIRSGKTMTAPTYMLWAERAHRILDGTV